MEGFIMAPLVIFLIFVAPLWIILHYKSKAKAADGLSARERAELGEMIEVANKMAARIETLESILDAESPQWREQRHEQHRTDAGGGKRDNEQAP